MKFFAATVVLVLASQSAVAGVCDYRPSAIIGSGATAAAASATGAAAGAGGAAKAAGLYTLTHSVTGATMLGSTAGGASAAGTVGIMGGTAGTGAAVLGVVMQPWFWIPAAVAAVGVGALEGGCAIAGK